MIVARVVDVAHRADERRDRADAAVARAQPRDLLADVEVAGLHANGHRAASAAGHGRKNRDLVAVGNRLLALRER